MKTVGSRAQVWNGNAMKTSGGLTKKDLFKKKGRIRSRRASRSAKRNQNLKNAGWTFKKGEFGAVKIEDKKKKGTKKKKGSKMKGGSCSRCGQAPGQCPDYCIEAGGGTQTKPGASVGERGGRGRSSGSVSNEGSVNRTRGQSQGRTDIEDGDL